MLLQERTSPAAREVGLPAAVVGGSLLLASLSLLLPSAPTYDPWSWIIWGREITHLDLDTVDGPSWKPLPVLVTTVTGRLGDASPLIWVAVARAGAIAAVVLAFLLARRLAGTVAGVAAAATLALMPWWVRNAALGNSEGLLVALVLGAIVAELHARRGWAFVLGVGAALLRPEVWPFLGLYALWLLVRDRRRLPWIAGGLLSLPLLWFGPEWWGSGSPLRAADRAKVDIAAGNPALADNPALQLVQDAIGTVPAVMVAGTAIALLLAGISTRRYRERYPGVPATDEYPSGYPAVGTSRDDMANVSGARLALALAGLAAAWIAIVAFQVTRGFSGNLRYLIPPAALLIIVGAAGLTWLAQLALRGRAVPAAAGAVLAVAIAAAAVAPDADKLDPVLSQTDHQVRIVGDLERLVDDAGGRDALLACGSPYTHALMVPQVAWRLGLHTREVALEPAAPAVVFHVKFSHDSRFYGPGLRDTRPHFRGREGAWLLSADCPQGAR